MIIVFSFTGNNQCLASHLGSQAGVPVVPVFETRKRRKISIMLDLLMRRKPGVKPIDFEDAVRPRILFVAPVWDRHLAHPMQTAMRQARGRFERCAVASLCGVERPGQTEMIRRETLVNAGMAPDRIWEYTIASLSTPDRPLEGLAASNTTITETDLKGFAPQIRETVAWLNAGDTEFKTPQS